MKLRATDEQIVDGVPVWVDPFAAPEPPDLFAPITPAELRATGKPVAKVLPKWADPFADPEPTDPWPPLPEWAEILKDWGAGGEDQYSEDQYSLELDHHRLEVKAALAKPDKLRPQTINGIGEHLEAIARLQKQFVLRGVVSESSDGAHLLGYEGLKCFGTCAASLAVLSLLRSPSVASQIELRRLAEDLAAIVDADPVQQVKMLDRALSHLVHLLHEAQKLAHLAGNAELASRLERLAARLRRLGRAAAEAVAAANYTLPRALAPPGRLVTAQPRRSQAPPRPVHLRAVNPPRIETGSRLAA